MNRPSREEQQLIAAIQDGLPLVPRPYAAIAARLGVDEAEVIRRMEALMASGAISRLGVVVRHRELGYRANGMVVWDVPDDKVATLGRCFSQFEFVTLCYRRERHLPQWPYNLFCMIHGQDRDAVMQNIGILEQQCGVAPYPHTVLFSRRRFKQRGAIYVSADDAAPRPAAEGAGGF
jgi:DNA-binding Lrp family transcriptional regulator